MLFDQAIQSMCDEWSLKKEDFAHCEKGTYSLLFDAGYTLEISQQKEGGMVLTARFCSNDLDESTLRKYLQIACVRLNRESAQLTWDRVSNRYLLQQIIRLDGMEKLEWLKVLQEFLNSLDFWYEIGHQGEYSNPDSFISYAGRL
jgi:hypothetical protein